MEHVERHPVQDVDKWRKSLDGQRPHIERLLRLTDAMADTVVDVSNNALREFRLRCVFDPTGQEVETWEALTITMQGGNAAFRSRTSGEDGFDYLIDGRDRRVMGHLAPAHAGPGLWLRTLWTTMTCREAERSRRLSTIPAEQILGDGGQPEVYLEPWIRTLQALWSGDDDLYTHLIAAMNGTDPAGLSFADPRMVLLLDWQTINLFQSLVQRDAEVFNQNLAEALRRHRDYWGAPENADDPSGFVSLPLLALASLAHDWEIPVEVESEYIPSTLVRGGWVGEFPV